MSPLHDFCGRAKSRKNDENYSARNNNLLKFCKFLLVLKEPYPLQKVIYDLIICDLYMPKMSGIDLLRLVRNTELTKDIPFIMITTVNSQENILEAIKENVSGYILKPFSAKTLHEKIVAIFRHGHLMK
jgi:CheY-like chemotaxis protein